MYEDIRPDVIESINSYVKEGIPVGDFLRAVLENNLMESFGRADDDNRRTLWSICAYVYNEIPFNCHGSPEKYRAWIDNFVLARKDAETCSMEELEAADQILKGGNLQDGNEK